MPLHDNRWHVSLTLETRIPIAKQYLADRRFCSPPTFGARPNLFVAASPYATSSLDLAGPAGDADAAHCDSPKERSSTSIRLF
jgi:hypothetical protein